MNRHLAILLLVVTLSHSYTQEAFYFANEPGILKEPFYLNFNYEFIDGLLPLDHNVLRLGIRNYIYDDRIEDFCTVEAVRLIIDNDSLFINSVSFEAGWRMVLSYGYFHKVKVPLSVFFPKAKENVFAEWYSDTIRIENNSCKETFYTTPKTSTNFIIVFDNGIAVKKGKKKCVCKTMECDIDSVYKQLDDFDSPDNLLAAMDPCIVYLEDSLKYVKCTEEDLDKFAEEMKSDSLERVERKKRLPKASVLFKPFDDSLFKPFQDTLGKNSK